MYTTNINKFSFCFYYFIYYIFSTINIYIINKWIIFSLYVYNCCAVNYKYFFIIYVFKKR